MFAAALPLDAAERSRFLQESCADAPLRRLVEDLLRSHDSAPECIANGLFGTADPDPAPKQLGPYRVLDRLGSGAMGVVYRALQSQPRREVALKVLAAAGLLGDARWRFRREAQLLGRLQHPGIAQVYEAGVEDTELGSVAWFAMELVRGRRLDEAVRPIAGDVRAVCALLARIADAVQHAHEQGVVHRDLKPANILVLGDRGDDLQPKVLDFGIARSLDDELGGTASLRTMTGQVFGTLPYMSPEQVRSTRIGPTADVYALGVIAFELLAGCLPIPVDDLPISEAMRRICDDEAPPLRRLRADVDADVETIVAVAMCKDVDRRYPSAAAFANDLRRWLAHEPIAARSPSAAYRLRKLVRRHRGLAIGIVAAFVVLLVATVVVGVLAVQKGALATQEHLARQDLDRRGRQLKMENYRLEMGLAIGTARSAYGAARLEALLAKWAPAAGEEDLRGFEWYLLRSFGGDLLKVLPTPADVYMLRWHPREPWLLVAGRGFVQVLDAERGTVRADLGLGGHMYGARWSPDGSRIAVANGDGVCIADLDAPGEARTIRLADASPTEGVSMQSVAWLGDGRRVVGISYHQQAWSVDLAAGAATAFRRDLAGGFEFEGRPHTDEVAACDGIVDGRDLTMLHAHDGFRAETSRWTHDGKRLAVTIRGRVAILGAAGATVSRHEQPEGVVATTWGPDGHRLATMAGNGQVTVLDVDDWHVVRTARNANQSEGLSIDWSPDGRWLATGCRAPGVPILDLGVPPPIRRLLPSRGHLQFFGTLQWHPRDNALLAVGLTRQTILVDADRGQIVDQVDGGWMPTWSPDGSRRASYEGDDVVVRGADGSLFRQTFTPEEAKTSALMSWTADGNALLVRVRGELWLWPPGSPARRLHAIERPGAIACAPNGDLACVTTEGAVCLLDLEHDRVVARAEAAGWPWLAVWRRDGGSIATLGEGNDITLRDGRSLAVQRELIGCEGQPSYVSWQPDGKRIAAAARGGVWLWNPDTGELTAGLTDCREAACVAFSPDGLQLAVMADRGEVLVYDTRSGQRRGAAGR